MKAFLLIVWTPYMCCNALVMFCTYIYQMQIDDSAWLAAKLTIFDEHFYFIISLEMFLVLFVSELYPVDAL